MVSFSAASAQVSSVSSGLTAPSGSYISPVGTVAPSGTYSGPSEAFAPAGSPSSSAFETGGHLPIIFTATVAEVYDDNIFVQPIKVSDYITQISLMGEYRVGNDKAIDAGTFDIFYAPSFDIYANHSAQDSFNNNVGAQYQYRFSKLTLGIQQTYDRQSAAAAAAGNLVTTAIYNTLASANYTYDEKFSVIGTFHQNITNYITSGYSNSKEWVGDTYFLYHVDPKISVGFGPKFGWLDLTNAPNQSYQDLLGRLNYIYSQKLSFELSAGGEIREYQGPAGGSEAKAVFSLGATYQPFVDTTLTLTASRQFEPSYNLYGQNYLASKVALSGRQRFLEKFYYNLSLGFENDSYQGAGVYLTGPSRVDNYYFVSTGFDWVPNNWLQASVYYKYQADDSNFSGFTFNDNQVGVSASFSY